jgi:hypothetical protein
MATPEEIAWAAGLFEGEGSITASRGTARLSLKMTDEVVVRNFAAVVGRGMVYGPYQNTSLDGYRRKPFWFWVCTGRAESALVLESIGLWLSTRRLARARQLGIDPQPRPNRFHVFCRPDSP